LNGGDSLATHLKNIKEIGGVAAIEGVQIRVWWHDLEPAKGVYDFSRIDAYLSALATQPTPKRLVIRVMDRRFNTSSPDGIVPSYLRSNYWDGGVARSKTGYVARLWDPRIMQREIALFQALGKRYDSHPLLEGFATEETALGLRAPYPDGYSTATLEAQYERFAKAVHPTILHTNLFIYTNWLGGDATMTRLLQALIVPQVAAGGPDIVPNDPTQAQQIYSGMKGSDFRGVLPLAGSAEAAELGGNGPGFTPQQIHAYAASVLHLNYVFWARNTWAGTASQQWKTGILPFLKTAPPVHTACPTSYGVCNSR
jgi:hypothetical protein